MSMHELSRGDSYLYAIEGDIAHYFLTGLTDHLGQVLFVINYPCIIGILFDSAGNQVSVQQRPLSSRTQEIVERQGLREAFSRSDDEVFVVWMKEIGFREHAIHVKRFFLQSYNIGIRDFPLFFTDILDYPSNYPEDDHQLATSELGRWSTEGLFELWLNKDTDLWLNRIGEVESS